MTSLLLRNLLFTLLQPGVVVGLLPYLILRDVARPLYSEPLTTLQWAASFVFIAGLIILIRCVYLFAFVGKGTLSPADRTQHLVAKGLYRFSRNPMYVGVMSMLIAEALFFGYGPLWIYLSIVFVAFNVFIIVIEEPRLTRDFGDEYEAYCRKVRRWV